MNKQQIILVTFFWLCLQLAHGQILQVDHRQFANDSIVGWLGDLQVNFSFNNLNEPVKDNEMYLFLGLNGNLSYFTKKDHYFWKNYLSYGQAGQFTFVSQGYSHFRVDLNYKKKFSPEFFGQIQYDITRQMRLRAVTGMGYRYVFFRSEKAELEYGLAGILEHERWDFINDTDGSSYRTLPKLASYVGIYRSFSHIQISYLQFYQVGYDPTDEVWRNRLSGTFEVDDELFKNFHLIMRFNYDYDFNPVIDDLKKLFFQLNNGIRYKF